MSPWGWCELIGVLLVALALFGFGVRVGLRIGGALPSAGPDPETRAAPAGYPARAARPGKDPSPEKDLTWRRTAVYLYPRRTGGWVYVGIAANPTKRARQHAGLENEPMKWWWPEIDRDGARAFWLPNRIAACCAEWALIYVLQPEGNTAPGSSDDAYCQDQPPIVPVADFVVPSPTGARLRNAVGWSPYEQPEPEAPRPVTAIRADRAPRRRAPEAVDLDGAGAWGPYP